MPLYQKIATYLRMFLEPLVERARAGNLGCSTSVTCGTQRSKAPMSMPLQLRFAITDRHSSNAACASIPKWADECWVDVDNQGAEQLQRREAWLPAACREVLAVHISGHT